MYNKLLDFDYAAVAKIFDIWFGPTKFLSLLNASCPLQSKLTWNTTQMCCPLGFSTPWKMFAVCTNGIVSIFLSNPAAVYYSLPSAVFLNMDTANEVCSIVYKFWYTFKLLFFKSNELKFIKFLHLEDESFNY